MIRQIIGINSEACDGCGICVGACHEGAIEIVSGRAQLIGDEHCDGFGDCLQACPQDAIIFEMREAQPFNEKATRNARQHPAKAIEQVDHTKDSSEPKAAVVKAQSQIKNWPLKCKFVASRTAFLEHAHLLIAADCSAFAYASAHNDFMRDRITLIACPKLDKTDYAQKFKDLLDNDLQSVTVLRMEVPCCNSLEDDFRWAISASGKSIPFSTTIVSTGGEILAQRN